MSRCNHTRAALEAPPCPDCGRNDHLSVAVERRTISTWDEKEGKMVDFDETTFDMTNYCGWCGVEYDRSYRSHKEVSKFLDESWWERDAQGIPLARVCLKCHTEAGQNFILFCLNKVSWHVPDLRFK